MPGAHVKAEHLGFVGGGALSCPGVAAACRDVLLLTILPNTEDGSDGRMSCDGDARGWSLVAQRPQERRWRRAGVEVDVCCTPISIIRHNHRI